MTRRVCVISTGGSDVILHVYDPESHRVTCSMTKVCSTYPAAVDADGAPGLTLGSIVFWKRSVIMVLVPLIHINTTSSTVTHVYGTNHSQAPRAICNNVITRHRWKSILQVYRRMPRETEKKRATRINIISPYNVGVVCMHVCI